MSKDRTAGLKKGADRPQPVAYGVVRDAEGKPCVDDPATLHPIQIMMLTEAEREALGLWPGPLAVDAQGTKPMEKVSASAYRAVHALVAASEIYADGKRLQLDQRIDLQAGGLLSLTGV